MINFSYLKYLLQLIHKEGLRAFLIKVNGTRRILQLPLYALAVPVVIVIRLISPWVLVRMRALNSLRIGHFVANTEMYLCERDSGVNSGKHRYLDLFHFAYRPICNQQLATMWKRVLNIWPSWVLDPIILVNRLITGA